MAEQSRDWQVEKWSCPHIRGQKAHVQSNLWKECGQA